MPSVYIKWIGDMRGKCLLEQRMFSFIFWRMRLKSVSCGAQLILIRYGVRPRGEWILRP